MNVTPDELWRAVGEALLQQRHRRGWKPIDIERAGGPSYKTVQAIEHGKIGTVQSLEQHAAALGVSIVDVIQSVLADALTPLTPEAAQIVRQYEKMTVGGRSAPGVDRDGIVGSPVGGSDTGGAAVAARRARSSRSTKSTAAWFAEDKAP